MADGYVVHREQIPASGTWQVRPGKLAGITPKAVIVFGIAVDSIADDTVLVDAGFFVGMSNGVNSYSTSLYGADALGTTDSRRTESGEDLVYVQDFNATDIIELGLASLVSGGLDVPVELATNRPYVNFAFFYGDNWQTPYMERVVGIGSGTRLITTGFSGSGNDNQIMFNLSCSGVTPSNGKLGANDSGFGFGSAYRQGAAGVPAGQGAVAWDSRNNAGSAQIGAATADNRAIMNARYTAIRNALECTDISDSSITMTYREGGASRGFYTMVLETDQTKAWCGIIDSLTANGTLTVSAPNFQGGVAFMLPGQNDVLGVIKTVDIVISGISVGDDTEDYCAMVTDEDGPTTTNCKSLQDNQFLNYLQDDGSEGWKSGAGDFALTSTGFEVTNVVVDGGGGGAPSTARKWLALVFEGAGVGPGPEILNINDLTHLHPVDSPAVSGNFLLGIPDLSHAHPVDPCEVSEVGGNFPLDVDDLFHAHPVDSPQVIADFTLDIDKLSHAHPVDSPTLSVGVTPLTINDLTHMHPIDQVDLGGGYPLTVAALTHAHPVDAPTLGAMEGDLTAMIGETDRWSANAGVELSNSQGADLNWHIVEIMFDGVDTSIAVDGVEVKGDAGIRGLDALTIGAEKDGSNRFNGNLGELRVYSGSMTGPERSAVRDELTTKWITG